MKALQLIFGQALFILLVLRAPAAVFYVDLNSTNPTPPYASWSSASTNIQSAIDAASVGDQIWVNNGVYQTGGRVVYGVLTNRVVVDKALTLKSVNGPAVTIILGNPFVGTNAVRCVELADNAVLSGFTLQNGATEFWLDPDWETDNWTEQSGGGVIADGANAVVTNCVISGCYASYFGGGAANGILENCTLTNNSASGGQYGAGGVGGGACNSALQNCSLLNNQSVAGGAGTEGGALTNCVLSGNSAQGNGGGAEGSTLVNCVLAGNESQGSGGGLAGGAADNCTFTANTAANSGGGAAGGTFDNCILFYNTSPNGANFSQGTVLNFCCTTPLPDSGANNFTSDPQLEDSAHLTAASPCIGAGSFNYVTGADLDGNAWMNPPAMGDDEFYPGAAAGPLTAAIQSGFTNVAAGFPASFTAIILGHATNVLWNFGDGRSATNQLFVSHNWSAPGNYSVLLTAFNDSNPGGISATANVQVVTQPVFYVAASGAGPVAPFNTWATAATNIQDAVDAVTVPGSLVLVTNGTYQFGGRVANGSLTNRVAVTVPMLVRSVNGAAATIIAGNPVIGDSAVRCVYLANGALFDGFTLTNGATRSSGDVTMENSGGGVRSESANTVVSNCVIAGSFAHDFGGGVEGGTIFNSTISGNTATAGGGAHGAELDNCVCWLNSASAGGGAVESCIVKNSALTANSAQGNGGAADGSALANCTLTGNYASLSGGGANNSTLGNCIVYFNTSPGAANFSGGALNFSCTTPLPANGTNNLTADPQLTDNAHIGVGSPCIGAGSTIFAGGTDIDGEAWANPPSIGCDEFYAGAVTAPLGVQALANYTNVAVGFPAAFSGLISGHATGSSWDFGDGTLVSNQIYTAHSWSLPGDYVVMFTAFNDASPGGVSATLTVEVTTQTVFYVAATNVNPVAPFNSWLTAATNLQDAVDAAPAGGTVLVNDGFYQFGGRVVFGLLTNRVAVARPMNLQSVNGATATCIIGNYENDDNAVRGVLLANGCTMTGFTVTNGATRGAGDVDLEQSGGGIWCQSTNVFVTNCVFTTCSAPQSGGGACGGTFNNCTFVNDSAGAGGGVAQAVLNGCTMNGNNGGSTGGGACACTLNDCTVTANSAFSSGGGMTECVANNCLIATNWIGWGDGGGVSGCTLTNCDLVDNNSPITAGGAEGSTLVNCRVLNNSAGSEGGGGGGADNCTLTGCLLAGNYIYSYGGGASLSTLDHCTLTNNWCSSDGGGAYDCILTHCDLSGNSAGENGGGACVSTANNCVLSGNTAGNSGGGYSAISFVYFGRGNAISNCAVLGNSASQNGGGVEGGLADNCTVDGNSAVNSGGGTHNSALGNCIVYFNTAGNGANFSGGTLNYCCTLPLPATGSGNLTNDPQLADLMHISAGSPCQGAGSAAYAHGTDIDGDAWLNPPSIGCDEFVASSAAGALAVLVSADYTNCAAGHTLNFFGAITGHASACVWDFGDGTTLTNQLFDIRHSWAAGGDFTVSLTAFNSDAPGGVSATVLIQVAENPVHYVSPASVNPVSPFTSWATAATNIQDAVDAAFVGGTVLVTNGIYANGGHIVYGDLTNRVAVTKPLTVQSVNGPGVTMIEGQPENNQIAVRCAYLTNGVVFNGFTLTNGGTLAVWDEPPDEDLVGGGIRAETNAVILNCVLINNWAGEFGGGAYGGILDQCTLAGNFSWYGGGASTGVLNGCVLSNNVASYSGWANGGGAENCALNNCVLADNFADAAGAAETCVLNNCAITANSAGGVGGVDNSTLNNCTLTGNSGGGGSGGASASALNNCILYYNRSVTADPNDSGCTLNFCCTPAPPAGGAGNITGEPQLADAFHLSAGSPCRGAGSTNYTTGTDIDGEAWANPPAIGCDEYHAGAITGALSVAVQADYTNVATGFSAAFTAQIAGHAGFNAWDFGDGTIVSNRPYAAHSYAAGGDYPVVFTAYNDSNPAGVSATLTMHVGTPLHYVALGNPNPVSPYDSWATAATNIQDAVNVTFAGGTVVVSNGLYQTGGLVINAQTNRVALTGPMNLQSVNGPGVTVIQGYQVPMNTSVTGAVSCVYLADRTTMSGFTLTNGSSGQSGGVWCETPNVVVSNCVITGNLNGGINDGVVNNCVIANNDSGANSCTLNNCLITNNSSGGISSCVANDCTLSGNSSYNGGGAYWSTLNRCIVANNSAAHEGGGMYIGDANDCLFTGNSASQYGGPGLNVNFNDCTIVNNSGGPGVCWLNNCVVYNNSGWNSDAYSTLNYCCTIPLPPGGTGNFTNDPAFVDAAGGNFRLQTNSPCINSGNNTDAAGTNDLDGNLRITGGTVDVGAYEFQTPASIISYAWLQQYGLPTDGSVDYADLDGTGMNNWQKWIAGLNPTNPASVLAMLPAVTNNSTGVTVSWQSVAGVNYFLQRCSNLACSPPFSTIQSNLAGQDGSTSYTDTTATNGNSFFYRVGVQQ